MFLGRKRKATDCPQWERDLEIDVMFYPLDIDTKMAALEASASVVSITSYLGENELSHSSGIIIEYNDNCGIILTSANIVKCHNSQDSIADEITVVVHLSEHTSIDANIIACDFHYNLAALKILCDTPLKVASLALLDDSSTIDPSCLRTPFQLRPHLKSYNLIPGNAVIALARTSAKPFKLMVAPGQFCLNVCGYDCKELLKATCKISEMYTPFLPVKIASLWWDHFKKYREPRRPWLGMGVTNLYAANLSFLENFIKKFPNIFKGVIVKEVLQGSSADSVGIRQDDVIVQFDGKTVQSFLELFESMWSKVGEHVELVVIRTGNDDPLLLKMKVDEATADRLYSWPLWR
ncbi:putative protease Do-like 14 isoform X2 [Mercurialis annua]|uniref:putative protease Do-like 14 isoform X2 n=1 Tax=Mercurialis annua TaxID=3986 RepID=UPI00215F3585|nr:putative protease Do-like 14 isoform X2 [Mercurialis annua]